MGVEFIHGFLFCGIMLFILLILVSAFYIIKKEIKQTPLEEKKKIKHRFISPYHLLLVGIMFSICGWIAEIFTPIGAFNPFFFFLPAGIVFIFIGILYAFLSYQPGSKEENRFVVGFTVFLVLLLMILGMIILLFP
ncbi:MAG: hypothetical protein QMC80_07165 [Thermoplasmatales archaeon]|nr:hypothetical protein [Thermoplasmatales archaeon]